MPKRSIVFAVLIVLLLALPAAARKNWAPISKEELALKDNPDSPGDHAMILERAIESVDGQNDLYDRHYYRIKIFTEAGKKRADVEIPYVKSYQRVNDIKARVISPDGAVREFDGQVFDKVIFKGKRFRINAKTFTLPDVQVGSILEYRYTYNRDYLIDGRWRVQDDLFTRKATFRYDFCTRCPYRFYFMSLGLPKDQQPKFTDRAVILELKNIPAFRREEHAPPEDELKIRVEYFYSTENKPQDPEAFWANEGREWWDVVKEFLGKPDSLREAVAQLVSESDAPEAKLRKLYARVQQMRNLTYERDKTEAEEKREKLKDNNNARDVWSRGYGYRTDLNRVFVALARAAGFDATVVRVARRDDVFFNRGLLDADQLNSEIAWVNAGGREYYLDPATPFCPFGLISWERTGVSGLKLVNGGGQFIVTPRSVSDDAITERKGTLDLTPDGSVQGTVTIAFKGLEALRLRLDALEQDEAGKKKSIEDEVRAWLPSTAQLELISIDGWTATDTPLTVNAKISVPGLAIPTGKRLLLTKGLFQTTQSHPFKVAQRTHPVYFEYAFQEIDDLTLRVPPELQIETTVTPRRTQTDFGMYQSFVQRRGDGLWLGRKLQIDGIFFRTEYYPELRSFYDVVRAGDEDNLVMQFATTAGN